MNNYSKIIMVGLVGLALIFWASVVMRVDTANEKKWDDCVSLANHFLPDPNETGERSEFIKGCFEQK